MSVYFVVDEPLVIHSAHLEETRVSPRRLDRKTGAEPLSRVIGPNLFSNVSILFRINVSNRVESNISVFIQSQIDRVKIDWRVGMQ